MTTFIIVTTIIIILVGLFTLYYARYAKKTYRENEIAYVVNDFSNRYDSNSKNDFWGFKTLIESDITNLDYKEVNDVVKRVQNRTSKKTDLLESIPDDIRNSPDLKKLLIFIKTNPKYLYLTPGELRGERMKEIIEDFKKSKK